MPRLRLGLIAGAVLAALPMAVQAASVEEALQLSAEGRPDQAARMLQPLAEAGDPLAQFNLGVLLENADPQLSARWYARSARGGEARAAYNLAHLYLSARGLPPDPEAAREAFARAAELGLPTARFNLAMMLERGIGGAVDQAAAQVQLQLAAKAGEARAMLRLAEQALDSEDRSTAWRWQRKLEATGESSAGYVALSEALGKHLRRVRGRVVNVRKGPGKRNSVVAKLKRGTQVLELERKGDWVRVALTVPDDGGETAGWIFARLLK